MCTGTLALFDLTFQDSPPKSLGGRPQFPGAARSHAEGVPLCDCEIMDAQLAGFSFPGEHDLRPIRLLVQAALVD